MLLVCFVRPIIRNETSFYCLEIMARLGLAIPLLHLTKSCKKSNNSIKFKRTFSTWQPCKRVSNELYSRMVGVMLVLINGKR